MIKVPHKLISSALVILISSSQAWAVGGIWAPRVSIETQFSRDYCEKVSNQKVICVDNHSYRTSHDIENLSMMAFVNFDYSKNSMAFLSPGQLRFEGLNIRCDKIQNPRKILGANLYGSGRVLYVLNDLGISTCGIFGKGLKFGGLPKDQLARLKDFSVNSENDAICAITGSDEILCDDGWGEDPYELSLRRPEFKALTNLHHLVAGRAHHCVLSDQGVFCWGRNYRYLNQVPRLNQPTNILAYDDKTCALDKAGVHCWGSLGSSEDAKIENALKERLVFESDIPSVYLDKLSGSFEAYARVTPSLKSRLFSDLGSLFNSHLAPQALMRDEDVAIIESRYFIMKIAAPAVFSIDSGIFKDFYGHYFAESRKNIERELLAYDGFSVRDSALNRELSLRSLMTVVTLTEGMLPRDTELQDIKRQIAQVLLKPEDKEFLSLMAKIEQHILNNELIKASDRTAFLSDTAKIVVDWSKQVISQKVK